MITKPVYIDDQQRDLVLTALRHLSDRISKPETETNNTGILRACEFTQRRLGEVIELFTIDATVNNG